MSGRASFTEVKADIPPILQGYNDAGTLLLNFGWDLDFFGRNRAAVAAATWISQGLPQDWPTQRGRTQ